MLDSAKRYIPVGSKYASVINQAIIHCKVVVLVFSDYSARSPWVESEINIAFSNRKVIIPYKIDKTNFEDFDEFYLMLNNRHWIEAYPDYKTRFKDLVTVVGHSLGKINHFTQTNIEHNKSTKKHQKYLFTTLAILIFIILGYTIITRLPNSYNAVDITSATIDTTATTINDVYLTDIKNNTKQDDPSKQTIIPESVVTYTTKQKSAQTKLINTQQTSQTNTEYNLEQKLETIDKKSSIECKEEDTIQSTHTIEELPSNTKTPTSIELQDSITQEISSNEIGTNSDFEEEELHLFLGIVGYDKDPKNYTPEAVESYLKEAELGNAEAQNNIGICYYNGYVVNKSKKTALKWFNKAAEQGHSDAQNNIGVHYLSKIYSGNKEAVKWFRKAAEQGHPAAQNYLGYCYHYGFGTSKDFKEAVKWYKKSAEQNFPTAQFNLGYCYEKGIYLPMNIDKAIELYKKVSEQDNRLAKIAEKRLVKCQKKR